MEKECLESGLILSKFVRQKYIKADRAFTKFSMRKDKKYGAVFIIQQTNDPLGDWQDSLSEKEKKTITKKAKKWLKSDTPVDTSDWITPSDEDIRIQIAKELFILLITKDDWKERLLRKGRIQALRWVKNAHSPPSMKYVGWISYGSVVDNNPLLSVMETLEAERFNEYYNNRFGSTQKSINEQRKEILTEAKKNMVIFEKASDKPHSTPSMCKGEDLDG